MSFLEFRSISRAIVLVSFLPIAATAQSNEVFLLQDSVQSGVGNTLFIDQSDAAASRAGSLEMPLQQIGGGNTAEILLEGFGAEVASFLQSSSGAGLAQNTATITGATEARIALEQLG